MGEKISQLPDATVPLSGSELIPIVQGGITKKVSSSNVGGATTLQEDITYAALVVKINAGTLTKGQQYKITDYATKHYIVYSVRTQVLGTIITGVTEPLLVTASGINTLEPNAYSALHPEDIIHYDWNPDNWLGDLSFSDLTDTGNPVIIPGFKGVIYFRHDTLLDNYMGYDFRNCKFRRWKTDAEAWGIGTTYAKYDTVTDSGFVWASIVGGNIANAPTDPSDYWAKLLDLSLTEYYNNNPVASNGGGGRVPSGTDFIDTLTFTEGVDALYSRNCRSNHWMNYKDNFIGNYDIGGTILLNNVFFLQNNSGSVTIYLNNFYAGMYGNTIASLYMESNRIGYNAQNNIIVGDYTYNEHGFGYSENITYNFNRNKSFDGFSQNLISNGFVGNEVLSPCATNVFGSNCQKNNINGNFQGNSVGAGFIRNNIQNSSCNTINFVGATHVYADYNTTIFTRVDGTPKLSYCDNSDVIQVVNANA